MIRIGVIEDEARMREEVCRYVEKTAGDFAEIQCRAYESAEQFLEENSEYEILILDIRLPGINGIELGRILRERGKDTKLLYLTSYAEYAAESYLVEASQYILKESMDRRLPSILQRMISEEIEQKKDYRIVGIKRGKKEAFLSGDIIHTEGLQRREICRVCNDGRNLQRTDCTREASGRTF